MERLIMVLYCFIISFAFLILSKIATERRKESLLLHIPILGFTGVAFLTRGMDMQSTMAVMGVLLLSLAVSELIARPILRRRIIRPCVRVKRLNGGGVFNIIMAFFMCLLPSFSLLTGGFEIYRDLGTIIFSALVTVALIIFFALAIFEKIEICENGVWDRGRLGPWYEYASFEWHEAHDKVELKLWSRSSRTGPTLLTVPAERRVAVQQLLAANLPELSDTGTSLVRET